MNLLVQKPNGRIDRVEVLESKDAVLLTLDIDNDGIGLRAVRLSLAEASTLSDHLNRIRRKVVQRKDWKP